MIREAVSSSSGWHWEAINALHGRTADGGSDPKWSYRDSNARLSSDDVLPVIRVWLHDEKR